MKWLHSCVAPTRLGVSLAGVTSRHSQKELVAAVRNAGGFRQKAWMKALKPMRNSGPGMIHQNCPVIQEFNTDTWLFVDKRRSPGRRSVCLSVRTSSRYVDTIPSQLGRNDCAIVNFSMLCTHVHTALRLRPSLRAPAAVCANCLELSVSSLTG
ncbi:hypothetical protein B0T11DRAFT_316710 [Plectosphaerella cucumerina]|uniref:Uncharacterized protein n=1 Tax=Plectosphaerella cucumerina TaxID=40658 RepID=A0A8K0TLJ3_9PEZI|nr:hypothetical protein B0T11DRAFT_316710 [Plectosphaerella cucumerina]